MNLLLVFVGGGFGAVVRYLVQLGWLRATGPSQPYVATAIINVTGSVIMGLLIGALARLPGGGDNRWRLLFGVGVLGGYTTFSSFSLEAVLLIERRDFGVAAAYILGSVALGLLGLITGLTIMRRLPF